MLSTVPPNALSDAAMASTISSKPPSLTLKYDATDFSTNIDVPTALFRITQINYVRVLQSGRFIIAIMQNEEAYIAHQSPTIDRKLRDKGLKLVESPEMLASRTLLARKIDDYVLSQQLDAITTEISDKNNVNIEELKIMPRPHMLKIRLSSLQECQHLLAHGLKLFSRVIPQYNMAQDTYTEVIQCLKCLQFTHKTSHCPATTDTCSKCSETGHNFKNCPSNTFKCCNCGGDHPAVAYKCPRKKEAVAAQRNESQTQPPVTYASTAAPTTAPPTTMPPPTPVLSPSDAQELKENNNRTRQCLDIATEIAQGDLSLMASTYKRLTSHNGLPSIDIPQDLIEELSEGYQQAHERTHHRRRHCRSRSQSRQKEKKQKKETPTPPAPAPRQSSRESSPNPTPATGPSTSRQDQRQTRNSNRAPPPKGSDG